MRAESLPTSKYGRERTEGWYKRILARYRKVPPPEKKLSDKAVEDDTGIF